MMVMLVSDFNPFDAAALWLMFNVTPLILMSLSEEMPCFLLALTVNEPPPLITVVPFVLITALPSLSVLSVRTFVVPLATMISLSTFFVRFNGTVVEDVMSTPLSINSK